MPSTVRIHTTTGQLLTALRTDAGQTVRDLKARLLAEACAAASSLDLVSSMGSSGVVLADDTAACCLPQSVVALQWTGSDALSAVALPPAVRLGADRRDDRRDRRSDMPRQRDRPKALDART